jgi:hypothetical protein
VLNLLLQGPADGGYGSRRIIAHHYDSILG